MKAVAKRCQCETWVIFGCSLARRLHVETMPVWIILAKSWAVDEFRCFIDG